MTWTGIPIPTDDRDDWLEKRKTGIGASDVAGILGLSPWATPFTVWADKTQDLEDEPNEQMRWGLKLEDVIVEEFEAETGLHVHGRQWLVRHQQHDWVMTTLDGLAFESPNDEWDSARLDAAIGMREIPGIKGNLTPPTLIESDDLFDPLGVVEVKTDGSWSRWEEVPDHYQLQTQWQMYCTGLDHCWVAVLHGGRRFEIYEVSFDKKLADTVFERVSEWRDRYIVGDDTPDPDGSPATTATVKGLWPFADDEATVEFSKSEAADVDALRAVKLEEKRIKEERARLEARLKVAMQEASVALVGGEKAATWPEIHTERLDQKALKAELPDIYEKYLRPSSYRRFNVKETK